MSATHASRRAVFCDYGCWRIPSARGRYAGGHGIAEPAGHHPQRDHAVLVPVLPSDIDNYAAAKCISDLLLTAKIRRED